MKSKRKRLSSMKQRRVYQKGFLNWFAENRHLFTVEPLKPIATVRYVDIHFKNMSSVLNIRVRATSISVTVIWKRQLFDMLLSLDMCPIKIRGAYRCRLCEESEETFPDLPSMRSNHLFAPFLEWCNQTLFTSRWLKMEETRGCSTASLCREITNSSQMAFPGLLQLKNLRGQPMFSADETLHIFYLPVFEKRTGRVSS